MLASKAERLQFRRTHEAEPQAFRLTRATRVVTPDRSSGVAQRSEARPGKLIPTTVGKQRQCTQTNYAVRKAQIPDAPPNMDSSATVKTGGFSGLRYWMNDARVPPISSMPDAVSRRRQRGFESTKFL